MARVWLSLAFVFLSVLAASCGDVAFSGNGVTPCGTDRDGGHCPSGMTCCRNYCYSAEHLPACLAGDAMGSDAQDAADVTPPTDVADAATDVAVDATDVADVSAEPQEDVLVADVTDVAADMNDASDATSEDVIADADVITADVFDAPPDVSLPDTGTDVPIMDVQPDVSPDVPADLPRDVIPDVVPDVPADVITDRPVDIVCPTGQSFCHMTCIDTQTDMSNCGRCDNACPSGTTCITGSCRCPITGQTLCGTRCVDTLTDAPNCGACGRACLSPAICIAGSCLPLAGRVTVNATEAAGWMSDFASRTFTAVRADASSRYFNNGELQVASYRYFNTSLNPSVRIARFAARFPRPMLPPGTRVTAVSVSLTAVEVLDNPPQRLVAVPYTGAWPGFNTRWPYNLYWGVTPGTSGGPDTPTLWSAEVSASNWMGAGGPTAATFALNPMGVAGIFMGTGELILGFMETHDAYGRLPDQTEMSVQRAGISFNLDRRLIQLLVDYAP